MKAFFTYLVILASGLAAGTLLRQVDLNGAPSLREIVSLDWGRFIGAADNPSLPSSLQKPQTSSIPVNSGASASVDEELDHEFAKQLGSLKGWRAFLDAHGDGAHARSARAEIERLRFAGKAAAPAADDPSNDALPAPNATSEVLIAVPPSAAAEAVAPTADEACRRDANRLVRFRDNPSPEGAERLARELSCAKLWPQFLAAVDSLSPAAHAPSRGAVAHIGPSEAKTGGEVGRFPPTAAAPEAAAPAANEVCRRDADRLARLRAHPSVAEAVRISNELQCGKLRPQLLPVLEDLSSALAPAPARSPHSADEPTNATLAEACASERAALDQLRRRPSAEGARLLWGGLRCQSLRPQVRLLVESLGVAPASSDSSAANGPEGSGRAAPDMVRSAVQPPMRPAAK